MQTKQDGRLGTEKIGKLMLELALPSVLAQIVNVLYNIVDRIYIGRIPDVGSLALTGVGVTFPIITIISAFAGFASGGGAPLAAIALGQKNRERAEKILGSSTSLLLFFSVLLMAFFFVFQTPLLYLFGASDNTIGYASTYISIYLVGTVFVDNGEGRACDPADISQPPGKPSGKGGFAHAKPAAVCDHSAGGERPGKTRTQGLCLRFIVGEIVHSSLQSIALFPMLPQFERSVKRNLQRLHTFFLVVYCLILGICQKAEDVWNTMYGGQGI